MAIEEEDGAALHALVTTSIEYWCRFRRRFFRGLFVLEHDARPGCPRGDHGYADHDGHRHSCERY